MRNKIAKFLTILFLFTVVQNSFAQQNKNGWYWANGRSQSNQLNWVKIIDASHYYAVGDNGTFMKSSDGGESWSINTQAGITDPSFGSGATMRLNTAWFFDANTGIVAGLSVYNENIKIRRTTDGGESFTTVDLGPGAGSGTPKVYDIYFINSNTGYLCGNNLVNVFKTTNAGLNWTLMPNLPAGSYNYSCINAIDENKIIIGLESEGIRRDIVKTTNGGTNWVVQNLPGSNIVDIKDILFQNSSTGFICGVSVASNPNYFATTTDGGASWTESVFPNKQHPLYALKLKGSKLYTLGASFSKYFYSSDLGVSWDSTDFSDYSNVYQPYDWFVYDFDINSDNEIIVGQNGKVNVSYDGGSSWRNQNYVVTNSLTTFSSVYALRGSEKVWAGTYSGGGILYSTNNGNNWTSVSTSTIYPFYDIKMVNSNTGYAVGGEFINALTGYCYKTVNGGLNWTSLTIPSPDRRLNSVYFVNENTGWITGGLPSGAGCIISKTTNGGTTWTSQTTSDLYSSAMGDVNMYDANTGYIMSGPNVWKTINGGTNWNRVNNLPAGSWVRSYNFSPTTVYFGGNNQIAKSFDGGASWQSFPIPSTIAQITSMDWTDLDNGTVAGLQGYTAKTTDGGLTWKERNTGTSTLRDLSMAGKDVVYTVCFINNFGAIFRLYDVNTSVNINLTAGIQGLWNGSSQVSDTVTCILRNSVSPYNIAGTAKALLNSSGSGTFTYNSLPAGNYYIEITHRNSIETWSASPVALTTGGSFAYNFTTAASQAYGNNLILKDGKYCDYSGDVNQDGLVDLTDVVIINNASSIFTTGYVVEDLNGDYLVDLSDLILALNNSTMFVAKVTP